jgi:hypothetical protein
MKKSDKHTRWHIYLIAFSIIHWLESLFRDIQTNEHIATARVVIHIDSIREKSIFAKSQMIQIV